jgi:hypothetical protein
LSPSSSVAIVRGKGEKGNWVICNSGLWLWQTLNCQLLSMQCPFLPDKTRNIKNALLVSSLWDFHIRFLLGTSLEYYTW